MSARLHDRAGSVLRGVGRNSSKIAGLVIEREEYPCGRVSWDIKRAPLVAFMAFAAIAGFAVAANLQDGAAIASKPPMKAEGAAAQPERLLQIQVRSDAPARAYRQGPMLEAPVAPSTVAQPSRTAPVPTPVAVQAAPIPVPVRRDAAAPALPAAPTQIPARGTPVRGSVAVPIAAAQEIARAALPPRSWVDDDPEVLAADRELATAYRDAAQAGLPVREIRADRQAWLAPRAEAAARSRGALLDAYRDHIDDLRDAAADAAARRQNDPYLDRYPQDPRGYAPGYGRYDPRF